ncbi:hypothetical protein Patl1_07628 [Pistacia atlantica]|uniref:Uncharacterized protein n=1 Tax=Pistacia atlantica TaxID=434234 RepID=A0ACC1AIH6_9ROSI|nr:hypothetical protein Patl1_07628 [Pistacia atlantica]
MGCICSKGSAPDDDVTADERQKELNIASVQLTAPAPSLKDEFIVRKSAVKEDSIVRRLREDSQVRKSGPAPGPGGVGNASGRPSFRSGGGGGGGGGRAGNASGQLSFKIGGGGGGNASARPSFKANPSSASGLLEDAEKKTMIVVVEGPKRSRHQRCATMDVGVAIAGIEGQSQSQMSRMVGSPLGAEGEQVAAGWPSWLASVAGEAIKGWVPRRADSFEKIEKIGQGTYSSVYKARDLETGKIVALKKVRFVNMDPESVRFMAREIYILRKVDHPNVMKLEGLVTSRMSGSLYLVFEYMEHDLAGLATTPGIKFTESQIKCYMQQLLRGLDHCHSRGVLHRDIKGSNLLINNDGVLKIGDFGLATLLEPDQNQPLTSRVVTLWYRAPELLLGATEYGPAIDLWSAGCILAELYAGKPIMPGRTEVEQMHKIFKLCGSPSDEYWQKRKHADATSFKPQQPYMRRLPETFRNFPRSALSLVDKLLSMEPEDRGSAASALKSEFFTTEPLPCDPSNMPKYPPSKELDARRRDEEERRQRADAVKRRGPESVRQMSRDLRTPEFIAQGQSKTTSISHKYNSQDDAGAGFPIDPPRGHMQKGYYKTSSVVHPSAIRNKNASNRIGTELRAQRSQHPQEDASLRSNDRIFTKEPGTGYVPKKNRIHYSGPLMPPGGNMDDLLREHERQIQQAVRKARLEKSGTNKNNEVRGQTYNCGRYAK